MTAIRIQGVTQRFGQTVALDEVSLQIQSGELFFLLGPSGCGKSTLLRIIAGLLQPTAGRLLFNDRDVTDLPTDQRNAVMCFQSYALWPHMTVAQNVSFGLEVRGVPREQRAGKIAEVLKLVRMDELGHRKPNELSGGQQQRVALARALAVNPACLLLDEPLSNLDAKLRLEMRSEIRRICKTAGFTTIYVTHDQKEALSVADRIAVLKDGRLMQVGSPTELYLSPKSAFVAEFIGQTNLITGEVTQSAGGELVVQTPLGALHANGSVPAGQKVKLSIRPEHVRIEETAGVGAGAGAGAVSGPRQNSLPATLQSSMFQGENSEHVLLAGAGGVELKAIASPPVLKDAGAVRVSLKPEHLVVLTD